MASNDASPRVSVCMLAYNQERYVAQAIESALAQETNFPFELVIGEDCSTDGTREIVVDLARRHPNVIRLNLAEQNQGAKANFMRTFAECQGEYLAILECDDYWTDPRKLQMQVDALDSNPGWAICFHPARCLYSDGREGSEVIPVDWNRPVATLDDLFSKNFIPTASALFRGGLQANLPDWFVEVAAGDWALHILNATRGDIGFLPNVMATYRVHAGGFWSGRSPSDQTKELFKLFSLIDQHFEGKYAQRIDEGRFNSIEWIIRDRDNYRRIYDQRQELKATIAELEAANASLQQWQEKWQNMPSYKASQAMRRFTQSVRSLKRRLFGRGKLPRMGVSASSKI